jgi:adenosylhomocysteinase
VVAQNYSVGDLDLADAGLKRIDWALSEMPVVAGLIEELAATRPLDGLRIGCCLHITAETANLARALVGAGAELALCASNPLSTQDDVAAALVAHLDLAVFARRGEGAEEYYRNIEAVLERRPQITLDDGADLVSAAHNRGGEVLEGGPRRRRPAWSVCAPWRPKRR